MEEGRGGGGEGWVVGVTWRVLQGVDRGAG